MVTDKKKCFENYFRNHEKIVLTLDILKKKILDIMRKCENYTGCSRVYDKEQKDVLNMFEGSFKTYRKI